MEYGFSVHDQYILVGTIRKCNKYRFTLFPYFREMFPDILSAYWTNKMNGIRELAPTGFSPLSFSLLRGAARWTKRSFFVLFRFADCRDGLSVYPKRLHWPLGLFTRYRPDESSMRMALYHPQVLGFDYSDLAGAKVMATSLDYRPADEAGRYQGAKANLKPRKRPASRWFGRSRTQGYFPSWKRLFFIYDDNLLSAYD